MNINSYVEKPYLLKALEELGFKEFTAVQEETFKALNNNRNLIVKSKTGSGKSHSFLVPIFNNLNEKSKDVCAIIVAPTNVLATQLFKMCKQLAKYSPTDIDIRLYDSNLDSNKEEERLKVKQPHIAIGTLGKLNDLIVKRNALKAYKGQFLVVDEADMCFEAGFQEELDNITSIMQDAKKLFISATFSEHIKPHILRYLENPIDIDLDNILNNPIEHIWIPIRHLSRISCLEDLLKTINPYLCLIFVNKKEMVPFVYNALGKKGYNVAQISGDIPKRELNRILKEINNLKYQYVVCTDIAARGMDILGVSHVIQYELPYDYEFYIHRSGRCGRMNMSGTVYALYDNLDDRYLDMLNKKGIKPTYYKIVDSELVPHKGRNSRKEREIPVKNYTAIAARAIPKSKKVKPGYKKKRQAEINKLAEKLKKKDQPKRWYR